MNKLIAALIACAFALGSVAAKADDKTPPIPVDEAKLKAEQQKAKADYSKLTPEEKAAYKKAKSGKKAKELAGAESKANPLPPATAEQTKAVKELKTQPKPLPDAKAHQAAEKEQEKKASGQ